jgi:3-deoxy-7-phosphoheptulonate synthase|tara:strand:- start:2023 stop:3408 length:1386 start_codon:yes stop_codon:yes gene_type:complete
MLKIFLHWYFFTLANSFLLMTNWDPYSWKNKKIYQPVNYKNTFILNKNENKLKKVFPLIYAGEADKLKQEIIKAQNGEAFILMGGDCAETFADHTVEHYISNFRILLQMTLIIMNNVGKPVIKIGRMAGQYAKPRSELFELKNDTLLPSYRGDIINNYEFDNGREYDSNRMIETYYKSVQTMNLIRALSQGGYADIQRIQEWNLDFVNFENTIKYKNVSNNVKSSLNFMKAAGFKDGYYFKKADFYTAHEAMLLNYEAPLTRKDSNSNNYYGCSAHMLWIGERTRQLCGAHMEYIRGIENPIGIKISDKCSPEELLNIVNIINPDNKSGKLTLIIRMGKNIYDKLPSLIDAIKDNNKKVTWICDPMHGNTKTVFENIKTRTLDDIFIEIKSFIDIINSKDVVFGGIHLEMTGENVTECLDFSSIKNKLNLNDNYASLCDPRLNADQCLQLAFEISHYLTAL